MGLIAIGRTGWTTAAQTRCVIQMYLLYKHNHRIKKKKEKNTIYTIYSVLSVQTKDKMCDPVDATALYPFTTTVIAKTTPRGKDATAGGDAPSSSPPPTSIPTEGRVETPRGTRRPGSERSFTTMEPG